MRVAVALSYLPLSHRSRSSLPMPPETANQASCLSSRFWTAWPRSTSRTKSARFITRCSLVEFDIDRTAQRPAIRIETFDIDRHGGGVVDRADRANRHPVPFDARVEEMTVFRPRHRMGARETC